MAYKLPLGLSVLHLVQPQAFNPLIPNELQRRRTVRPLKIKILSKNLSRQRCVEGFNFVAKRLKDGIKSHRATLHDEIFFSGDLLLEPCISLIYAWKTNRYNNY